MRPKDISEGIPAYVRYMSIRFSLFMDRCRQGEFPKNEDGSEMDYSQLYNYFLNTDFKTAQYAKIEETTPFKYPRKEQERQLPEVDNEE